MSKPKPCEHCDGDEEAGPAVARVVIRDYDGGTFTVNVCKQCEKNEKADTVRVLRRFDETR
jgi:hypothetical protein